MKLCVFPSAPFNLLLSLSMRVLLGANPSRSIFSCLIVEEKSITVEYDDTGRDDKGLLVGCRVL